MKMHVETSTQVLQCECVQGACICVGLGISGNVAPGTQIIFTGRYPGTRFPKGTSITEDQVKLTLLKSSIKYFLNSCIIVQIM